MAINTWRDFDSSASLLVIIFCLLCPYVTNGDEIRMRMVEEPVNLGQNWNAEEPKALIPKVKSANFSGPPHLRRLYGKCFEKSDSSYKYEFCPFKNVTQYEQTLRWNPYSGILGIWEEWDIRNNTFYAMMMKDGDTCGERSRQVAVHLECGKKNEIGDVSEPDRCQYKMIFKTPLVCHQHSLLVYPTLSEELQRRWDDLEAELFYEEITQQGYNKRLHKIFEEAGYMLDPKTKPEPAQEANDQHHDENSEDFQTLDSCKEAYQTLKQEVERLQGLLVAQNPQDLV
ncbi:N-acetylglucosamine-1-phosphotransferase subunit gamma-like isoform X2 [Amphiura filiformis]|uniref:N-acetylglucosamine-1-phosphotransferase subunit gamma-like isoform X2 n=1 Tax=Amphiura filiformis TaxID=82378 RepID=UPI003B20FAF1